MEQFFCKDKKGFCKGIKSCRECEFAKGSSVINGHIAHDVLKTLFGDNYDLNRLRELWEADRDSRCVVYKSGYPVVSQYYKDEDGLCIREVSGVVEEQEYYNAVFNSLSPEAQKLHNDILTGECMKGADHADA